MNTPELRNNLAASLQTMYDMEIFASMMEFCQGELRVLLYLHLHDKDEIYPSDLSNSLYVTRQRITSILSSLRKKGYVHMEMAEDDRRKMWVVLTDSGKKQVAAKETEIDNYFNVLIDGLGENNIQEMTRLINLTIDKFKQSRK